MAKGYEIMFETFDGEQSCIQIVRYPDRPRQKFHTLKIKDPSFISQNNLDYTFYFGKITLRALYTCKDRTIDNDYFNGICHSQILKTDQIQVGVKSENSSINTSLMVIDNNFCSGHLNHKTCLLRYESEQKNLYAIIMQPMPEAFQKIQGIFYNSMINDPIDHVISEKKERWRNGLVFKIKQIHSEIIAYQVIIKF